MKKAFLLFAVLAGSCAAQRLEVRYFHDEDKTSVAFTDLAFAGERGMAVGTLRSESGDVSPYGLTTTDAGRTWTPIKLPLRAVSLFLDERAAWVCDGEKAARSDDFGRTWKRVGGVPGARRVFFADQSRGWALGPGQTVYQTTDGGTAWRKMPIPGEIKAKPENTVFRWLAFANAQRGMMVGVSRKPRVQRFPAWMDPEQQQREVPAVTIVLDTGDGGATWKGSEASMFGVMTRVRLQPTGHGLILVEFLDVFPFPTEVFGIHLGKGTSERVFREKDRAVTDVLSLEGEDWLVAMEVPGQISRSPIPSKLHLLHRASGSSAPWTEVPVDYRAVANRAVLARCGDVMWVATNTGMLLSVPAK